MSEKKNKQTALLCLEVLSRLHQLPIDIRSVVREYGFGENDLSVDEWLEAVNKKNN